MLHRHSVSSFAFILRAVCAATKRRPDAVEASGPRIDWAPPKASWECHFKKSPSRSTPLFCLPFLGLQHLRLTAKSLRHIQKPLGTSASEADRAIPPTSHARKPPQSKSNKSDFDR